MRFFPIIPIWLMAILCIGIFIYLVKKESQNKLLLIRDGSIIILLFLINLRIMIPSDKEIVAANNLDVLFVIDSSISMNGEDYNGNHTRLDGVYEVTKYITNQLMGARFSVISFDDSSEILTPYTRDTSMTLEAIEILRPKTKYSAVGSSLNSPIENMEITLSRAQKEKERPKIVFFISDGEITREEDLASYASLKKYIHGGAVLGFGTEQGGYMKTRVSFIDDNEIEYIMDVGNNWDQKAVTKIDEKNLRKIADDMDIPYIHIEKEDDIKDIVKEIKKTSTADFKPSDKMSYSDTYFFLLIPLFVLLLFALKGYKGEVK